MTLKLEGRIIGEWALELDRVWRPLADSLGSKNLVIDLRGVMNVDSRGKQILADIRRATGAEFVADTPMTKYFATEARRGTKKEAKEGA